MYDKVIIWFVDGTFTTTHIHEDDGILEAIEKFCEQNDYDYETVQSVEFEDDDDPEETE